MPLYAYTCAFCGKVAERFLPMGSATPQCCGKPMQRQWGANITIKAGSQLWMDRMDDIHKAQKARGERLRIVQPWEVKAT